MVYWVLLLITALFAYLFGSLDTMVLASNFVFHRNLRRLGDSRVWLSNFRRLYGFGGFAKLLAVELVKDLIPILIGALLLGIKGHVDAGRAFAALVMVMGSLWPLFGGLRGNHAPVAYVVACLATEASVGIAAAIVMLLVTLLTRYVPLGTVAGVLVSLLVIMLVVDDVLLTRLLLITAGLVLLRQLPAIVRILRRREPRLSFEQDITYKLDE